MTSPFRFSSGRSPLWLAFVLALALHGLLLSYLQLKRSRQAIPEILQSRDNTPELLQFASQPQPVTSFDVLSLPKASVLPPPPSNLLAPLRPSPGARKKVSGTGMSQAKQPRPKPQGKIALKQTNQKGRSLRGSGSIALTASAAKGSEDWGMALEQLRTFQRHEQGRPSAGAAEPGGLSPAPKLNEELQHPVLRRLDAAQLEAYQALWNRARPQTTVPWDKPATENGGPPIEVRQLPLEQIQGEDLRVRHRDLVVLGDQVLLVWIEGQQVWLLRSAREMTTPS